MATGQLDRNETWPFGVQAAQMSPVGQQRADDSDEATGRFQFRLVLLYLPAACNVSKSRLLIGANLIGSRKLNRANRRKDQPDETVCGWLAGSRFGPIALVKNEIQVVPSGRQEQQVCSHLKHSTCRWCFNQSRFLRRFLANFARPSRFPARPKSIDHREPRRRPAEQLN